MISSNIKYNIGEVYGEVLFQLASEQGLVEEVKEDLDELDRFMFSEGDFNAILDSPYLSIEHKTNLVEKLFSGRLNELTVNFLLTAGTRNRLSALPNIIKKFNKLYRYAKGHKDVWITISHAVGADEKEAIRSSLAQALKTENITLEFNVEPEILGGAIIKYEGKMIDNSVRTRLRKAVGQIIAKGRTLAGKSV